MARFDVYHGGGALVLDVQADSLPYLKTRMVVPLFLVEQAPRPLMATLNPEFAFDGKDVAMMTQYAGAIEQKELGATLGSLVTEEYAIGRALDMLLTGI